MFLEALLCNLDIPVPGGSEVKASASNARDPGSIPGSGRSPGEGNGNPLQYSCLENPMDGETQQVTVHGVTRVRYDLATKPTRASLVAQTVNNLPAMRETRVRSPGQEEPLEGGMATHSSPLAWRTPWTEVPGGLQSMGSQRVRHD